MKRGCVFLLCIGLIALPGCDSDVNKPQEPSSQVAMLRMTNEISGWHEKDSSYKEFDIKGLYALIDGGATIYEGFGMIRGIYQDMESSAGKFVTIFAEDYGTAKNTDTLYKVIVDKEMTDTIHITGYPTNVAVGSSALGGGGVYAHFRQYYFWLNFTGYSNPDDIIEDAIKFLKIYQTKIGGLP